MMDPAPHAAPSNGSSRAPHRSRAERRAAALRNESAATAALTVLGQKWVMRIVRVLGERTQRFCELQDALGGANSATLSQRLKLLEGQGLVDRTLVSEVPPWVEVYRLPDHVKFNHKRHVKAGIQCLDCHGPVPTMDVMHQYPSLKMGWCVSCHRQHLNDAKNPATLDCVACHH